MRSHWAIENSLHRVLDMIFRDDACRLRTDHAPADFCTIGHMGHNLIRRAPGKASLRLKRKAAGWDDAFLASLIAQQGFSPGSPALIPAWCLRRPCAIMDGTENQWVGETWLPKSARKMERK